MNLIKDHILRHSQLLRMAMVDIKRRHRDSKFGWAWEVISPFFQIFIYWFALKVGLRSSVRKGFQEIDFFSWLLVGLIAWFFIADIITSGMNSMRKYSYLITTMKFPVRLIPTFVVLARYMIHIIFLAGTLVFLIISHDKISLHWLQLPLYMGLLFLISWAWSQVSAPIAVISKDFANVVGTIKISLFWLSGILFDVDSVSSHTLHTILELNPVTFIVQGYRNSLILHTWFWERPNAMLSFLIELVALLLLANVISKNTYKELPDAL